MADSRQTSSKAKCLQRVDTGIWPALEEGAQEALDLSDR